MKKQSTEPYKGVRDFFPEDMAVQNQIFSIWRKTVEKYGYEEYNASVLEPSELYRAKSGEELVNEQTYNFIDRGKREVTLRPEMTPTVARMVASRKRELLFPLRWYSIPNLFRYEQPQRGRLREHWQLNVDIFGVSSNIAEIEIIDIAYQITKGYGLSDDDFIIRVNDRRIIHSILDSFGFSEEQKRDIIRLIDKKDKMEQGPFEATLGEFFTEKGGETAKKSFLEILNCKDVETLKTKISSASDDFLSHTKNLEEIMHGLQKLSVKNAIFDLTLMRGFDYYTGPVFEIFSTNKNNRRSVFGGGRYDDLLSLFGEDKVPAVGFGAGDVIARDLIETYGSLPAAQKTADVAIAILGEQNAHYALEIANRLRQNMRVWIDFSNKKIGDQIGNASRHGFKLLILIGDNERSSNRLTLKNLESGEEKLLEEKDIVNTLISKNTNA